MTKLNKIIAAVAAATIMLPLASAAEAKHKRQGADTFAGEFEGKHKRKRAETLAGTFEDGRYRRFRNRDLRDVSRRRGNRRDFRYGDYRDASTRRGRRFDTSWTPRIDERIARQKRRIRRGIRTGRFSRFEAMRLRSRLFAIRSAKRIASIDGRISFRERRRLMNMLDRNNRRIRNLRRNGNRNRWF